MGNYKLPFASPEEEESDTALLSSTATSSGTRRFGLKLPKVKKLTFSSLWKATKEFFSHPVNIAITVWMLLTVPACVVIGLDYAGMWEKIVKDEKTAVKWVEICTQVVNSLFVLMCLVVTPLLVRHSIQIIRWHPQDKIELRQFYCKNGSRKPHDRSHMAIVLVFEHLTCWATFAFSIIFWLYPVGDRPEWLVNITFATSWAAPLIALFYLLFSPLSKNYDIVHAGDDQHLKMYERSSAFFVESRLVGMGQAQWDGGVVPGCLSDKRVALCVTLLPCCMFGYNMERLGFGHRAVHTSAFLVVIVGPILVFALSAAALMRSGVPLIVLLLVGVGVGVCGLGYGGLWRMKMRSRFGLPGSSFSDVCCWMWCSLCTLCQEIRTADQYDVQEGSAWKLQVGAPRGTFAGTSVTTIPMEDDDYPHERDEPRRPRFSFSRSHRSGRPSIQHMQRSEDEEYEFY